MSESPIYLGQARVTGFFAICCLLALMNMVRTLSARNISPRLELVLSIFIVFSGLAAWYLYVSKSAGWYLSLLTVANWFAVAITAKILFGFFAICLSVGMVAVLIWLFRREVIDHFQVKLLRR